jgi:hypothetical protein
MSNNEQAKRQAEAQLQSILATVASLNCNYDRLEELQEERDDLESAIEDTAKVEEPGEYAAAVQDLADWDKENMEELQELRDEAGECKDRDEALERITDDALEVAVRSGWSTPGELEAEEYNILLCTGGPAVRIRGELSEYKEPESAWLEYQDWGTPWEVLRLGADEDAVLTYARCFFFGE